MKYKIVNRSNKETAQEKVTKWKRAQRNYHSCHSELRFRKFSCHVYHAQGEGILGVCVVFAFTEQFLGQVVRSDL